MSNENLIREVDEELRRDRMRKLWRQAGPWVIGGAVAVVAAVGGYEAWMSWQKSQSSKSSDLYYAATDAADGKDLDAAKKALDDVIAQASGGYPTLAQFREAALLGQQGKIDEAVAVYDGLSSSLTDPHLREIALLLGGSLLIDKGDVGAVQQRVGGSIQPSSPLRNSAREVLGLAQYKAGKFDDAMKSFTDIMNDPLANSDTRQRVQIYVLQLQAEGAKPIAPPTDETLAPSSEAPSSASAPVASSAEASVSAPASSAETSVASSAEISSAAPVDVSAAPSADASTAVDASTELDVTPPAIVDDQALSLAMPAAPDTSSAAPDVTPPAVIDATSSASAPFDLTTSLAPSSEAAPASSEAVAPVAPVSSEASSSSSTSSSAP